jgi:formylmethanofuran dehydrogenase subunit E
MAAKCIHKYRLKDLARKKDTPPYHVYVCVKQTCSHNIRIDLVDGKIAECNRCGEPFVMKLAKLRHGDRIIVRPHCQDCTKSPNRIKETKDKIESELDKLMESILPKGL